MNLRGQVAWEVLPGEDSEEPRHVNLGVRWFTSHERFNCQVTARKRIARGGIARILRIPNTEQLNFQ
jgi:hypothetical protein